MKRIFTSIILAAVSAFGQARFDVVSIKPSDPLSNGMHIGISPSGSFEASGGVNLLSLISQAYDVRFFQIVGGTGWMNDDKYTIATKDETTGPTGKDLGSMTDARRAEFHDQMMAKVQAMLADRFQLKIHRETREMPIYALTVAKSGLKMQISQPMMASSEMGINMEAVRMRKPGPVLAGKLVPMDAI